MAATSASNSPKGKEKDRGNMHSIMVAIGTITDIRYSSGDDDGDDEIDDDDNDGDIDDIDGDEFGDVLSIEVISDDIGCVEVDIFFIQAMTSTVTTNTIAT